MAKAQAAEYKTTRATPPGHEPVRSTGRPHLRVQEKSSEADLAAEKRTPRHNRWTQTTRYLSAAAYRSRRFRNQALSETVWRPYRAIAPSFGADLATVLHHCRRARRRLLARDTLLVLALLVPFAVGGRMFYEDLLYVLSVPEAIPTFVEFYPSALLSGLGVAFLIVFGFHYLTEHTLIAKRFNRGAYSDEPARSGDKLAPNSFDATVREVAGAEADNLIVYGGFSPFVGAGFDHGGWSFAVNVEKAADDVTNAAGPRPFAVSALYDRIEGNLKKLQFLDLDISDKLFVSGENVRDLNGMIAGDYDRPTGRLPSETVARYLEHPTESVRHYKCIQRVDWDGELIVTVFLRLFKTEEYLYAETNYFLAPPLKAEFHELDQIPSNLTFQRFNKLLFGSLLLTPGLWLWSVLSLGLALLQPFSRWQDHRQERIRIRNNRRFNYGAHVSIRDLAASAQYREFFQKLDKEMYSKLIDKEILNTVIDFLDEHAIDTSELRDRQTTILNNGVIMSGGSIKSESLSMGSGAKATLNRLRSKS